jgi:arylsulfatase A-like enzyme
MIRWPGRVPAGVVTNEMLVAVDRLPTLAGMVGASKLVPKDRPIDGVDASPFMLGKNDTTGRDSYMFFGIDGQLMSINGRSTRRSSATRIVHCLPSSRVPTSSRSRSYLRPE